jgi:hypothetical protein
MRTQTSASKRKTPAPYIPLEIWQEITSYPTVADDYDSLQTLRRVAQDSRHASEEVLEKRTLVLDSEDKFKNLLESTNPPAYMRIRVQGYSLQSLPLCHLSTTGPASKIKSLREVELDIYSDSKSACTFMDNVFHPHWYGLLGHAEWTVWFSRLAATDQSRIAVHGPASVPYPITSVISSDQTGRGELSICHYLDMLMAKEAREEWMARCRLDSLERTTKQYNTWLPKQIGHLTKSHYIPSARVTIYLDYCSRRTVRRTRKIVKASKGEEEVNIVWGRPSPSHMDQVIGHIMS